MLSRRKPSSAVRVSVKLRGEVKEDTGIEEIVVTLPEGAGLVKLLEQLEKRLNWPFMSRFVSDRMDHLNKGVVVLVNRMPVRRHWKDVKFRDGVQVILFPHTVCGG